jgi:hypothetical protein
MEEDPLLDRLEYPGRGINVDELDRMSGFLLVVEVA